LIFDTYIAPLVYDKTHQENVSGLALNDDVELKTILNGLKSMNLSE